MFIANEIVQAVNGRLVTGNRNTEYNSFSKDTRTIKKGDFYIPLVGENFNGHDYIENAVEKGATGFFIAKNHPGCEEIFLKFKEFKNDVVIIEVDDTLLALQSLAKYNRHKHSHVKLIAVTGSVGKTSTKEMIYSVLKQEFKILKTEGNLNNHIGLPLTLLRLSDEDLCVLEMGMNNSNEISFLSKLSSPDIAVITNIGVAHIGNLGSVENIFKAKAEILDGLKENGLLIVNGDDNYLKNIEVSEKINVVKYGIENDALSLSATGITFEDGYTCFSVEDKTYKINALGKHNVYNALSAMAIGKALGMSHENILQGYQDYQNEKMRMQNIHLNNNILLINDAYNANYDSMKAGIETVGEIAAKRKIVVLGDMFELGEFSGAIHRSIGELFATNTVDILITCGNDSSEISRIAGNYLKQLPFHYNYKQDAINKLIELIAENDLVYFKASRGMKFEEIVDSIIKHFGEYQGGQK